MLQKLKKFARTAASFSVLVAATAGTALADCGGFNTTDVDQGLTGFLNVITGTPFRVGAAIALVVGVVAILFDGGHVPQYAKVIVGVIVALTLTLAVIGWILSKGSCGSFSFGS